MLLTNSGFSFLVKHSLASTPNLQTRIRPLILVLQMPFDREQIKKKAIALAAKGVFIGTSSWKYTGWFGQLYTPTRYEYRGKLAKTRFEQECLSEYAEVFKTVAVDATYYKFPTQNLLESLVAQVTVDFKFGLKVTGDITIKRFTRDKKRYGQRAGKPNENFLNADLFNRAFLQPCESIRGNVGVIMFEFSRFHPGDSQHCREFMETLHSFLGKLPKGWPWGAELRNERWLSPEYFACLASHGIAHVFNSWEAMPPVAEQLALPNSRTNSGLVAARFLLKPGRKYNEAVDEFHPYARVQDEYPEARAGGKALIAEGKAAGPERKTYIYVNNRLEGNALETIEAMLSEQQG